MKNKPEATDYLDQVDEENMTLYRIVDEIKGILENEDEEIDKAELLSSLQVKLETKLENIAYVRQKQKAKIQELEAGIKKLTQWRDRVKKQGEWLDAYTVAEMERAGIKKFEGQFITLSRRKKPVRSVVITGEHGQPWIDEIDPDYIVEVVEYKVDKRKAIAHYKETGEKPKGFDFVDDEESLVIS